VLLGSGLLARAGEHLGKLVGESPCVCGDSATGGDGVGRVLLQSLAGRGVQAVPLEMADGERFKRLATLGIAQSLIKAGADRSSVLIALAESDCDVTGFLASVLHARRGGHPDPTHRAGASGRRDWRKNGVNLQSGKNLIGRLSAAHSAD